MADSPTRGRLPALLLAAGLIGATSLPAIAQDTVYVGGTGDSVELNLDVLDSLGTPPTVPEMLKLDIQRSQRAAGVPLPLPGEAKAPVSRAVPLPPPGRPTQSRRVTLATPAAPTPTFAAPTVPSPRKPAATIVTAPKQPAASSLPSARLKATAGSSEPTRIAGPVPSAPKVAETPAPKVAAPAKVSIPAPAPKTASKSSTLDVPPPPSMVATSTSMTEPTVPKVAAPKVEAPAVKAPAVPAPTAPSSTVKAPAAKAPAAKQVASAAPQPSMPAPKASAKGLSVAFGTDDKTLPASADTELQSLVGKLKADEHLRVELLAYASSDDNRSSAKARRLSLSRALEVRSYLIGQGIASTRMDVRALGDQAPNEPRDRVDITLVTR